MNAVFLCGPLTNAALRAVVLGRETAAEPAILPGYRLEAGEAATAFIAPEAGAQVEGLVSRDLGADDVARLDFHAGGVPPVSVAAPGGERWDVRGAVAEAPTGKPWDQARWTADWAAIETATAGDMMALFGQHPARDVTARRGLMQVRGASRVRAGAPGAAKLRGGAAGVDVAERRTPYAKYFALEEYDLAFRKFDGTMSQTVTRAVFVSGDAVTVLPYDPVRDRVLLVEQFRAGPFARGDVQPWQLEPIAGRIDPGETPEDCARREATEEAGLTLGALLPVAPHYPSPGAKSEFLYTYVALTDLPDGVAGVFGLEGEAEDIRGHLVDFAELMALVASGEVANGPLILTAFWLQRERSRLRRASPDAGRTTRT